MTNPPSVEVEVKPGGPAKGDIVASMISEAKSSGKLQALEDFIAEEPMLSDYSVEEVALVLPEVFPGKSVDECVKAMSDNQADLEKVVMKLEEISGPGSEAKEEEESAYSKMDKMSAESPDE